MSQSVTELSTNNFIHNYSEAFLLYLEGRSIEELSETLDIPLDLLRNYAGKAGWGGLRVAYREMHPNELAKNNVQGSIAKMEANREINLAQARKLQSAVDYALQQLNDEILKGPKKVWVDVITKKGEVVKKEVIIEKITPKNLRDLACALATVHDLTYRALGDHQKQKDANGGDVAPRAQIVVNLPAILAAPRDLTRVIEVEPATQSKPDPASNVAQ